MTNEERINHINGRIDDISTRIEILDKLKVDTKGFVKVSSTCAASAVALISAGAYIADASPSKIATYAILGSCGLAAGIYLGKKKLDETNEGYDFQIRDNLREVDRLEKQLNSLQNKEEIRMR